MTQSIRDAAQALIDIVMQQCGATHLAGPAFEAAEKARALRAALSAPQPTADERVAEHMRLVESAADDWAGFILHGSDHLKLSEASFSAVEQSARALLSASQEDSKQQARLVDLVLHMAESKRLRDWEDFHIDLSEAISIAQALKEPK